MKRRDFIKYSACGLTALAVGSRLNLPPFFNTQAHAHDFTLGMTQADVEMIDGKFIPHWVFTVGGIPTFPGPVIFHIAGETTNIDINNGLPLYGNPALNVDRTIAVVGTGISTPPIPRGGSGILTIPPSLAPGTYLYKDATLSLDPLSRVLGLHGALIVLPSDTANNPYPGVSIQVDALFTALGAWGGDNRAVNALFPGQPWFASTLANPDYAVNTASGAVNPEGESDRHHHKDFASFPTLEKYLYRTRIWLHSAIDPALNDSVINLGVIPSGGDPVAAVQNSMPQYFTINGRSGAYGGHSYDVMAISTIGEPHIIRLLNAGMATHSPHIHGNHVFILAVNNVVGDGGDAFGSGSDNLMFVDTMTLRPEDTVDWLLPYVRPPDIPLVLTDGSIYRPGDPIPSLPLMELRDLIPQELNTVLIEPQDPLTYPMHSHMELDQTAAGGNYPQGTIAMWEIIGEFGAEFAPDAVPEAPNRPRGRGRGRGGGQG